MIVGYVISILYRKESHKEKERRMSKRPVDKKSSEDIFKELQKSLQQTLKDYAPAPSMEKAIKKTEKPKMTTSLKQEVVRLSDQKKSLRTTFKPRTSVQSKSSPMKENEAEDIELEADTYRPDFDLRNAIIYSEILKRPQF